MAEPSAQGPGTDALYRPVPTCGSFLVKKILDYFLRLGSQSPQSVAWYHWNGDLCSKIASEYAAHYESNTAISVFRITASDQSEFVDAYASIGRTLEVSSEIAAIDMLGAVRRHIEAQSRWLLVVDVGSELNKLITACESNGQEAVIQYIPKGPNGAVLWATSDITILEPAVARGLSARNVLVPWICEPTRVRMDDDKKTATCPLFMDMGHSEGLTANDVEPILGQQTNGLFLQPLARIAVEHARYWYAMETIRHEMTQRHPARRFRPLLDREKCLTNCNHPSAQQSPPGKAAVPQTKPEEARTLVSARNDEPVNGEVLAQLMHAPVGCERDGTSKEAERNAVAFEEPSPLRPEQSEIPSPGLHVVSPLCDEDDIKPCNPPLVVGESSASTPRSPGHNLFTENLETEEALDEMLPSGFRGLHRRGMLADISAAADRLALDEPSANYVPNAQLAIRSALKDQLRDLGSQSAATVAFTLAWNPVKYYRDRVLEVLPPDSSTSGIFGQLVSFTGTLLNAQALTVEDYMEQTWSGHWSGLRQLLERLLVLPFGEEAIFDPSESHSQQTTVPSNTGPSVPKARYYRAKMTGEESCLVTVSGNWQLLINTGEQLGWLGSTLRSVPTTTGRQAFTCIPSITGMKRPSGEQFWTCDVAFETKTISLAEKPRGSCWTSLVWNPVLVEGYPIRARPQLNTGLEAPLSLIAELVKSWHLVQFGDKIMIKGYQSMVVATGIDNGVVSWHALTSNDPDARITYHGPELDEVTETLSDNVGRIHRSSNRHIIGWCTSATSSCGNPSSDREVTTSGLPDATSSIVIDRLHIEAGEYVVVGMGLALNKKEEAVPIKRGKDYIALLESIGRHPVVFSDVSSQRAWLVDGASALLHLVRIAMKITEQSDGLPFQWLFDEANFKSSWPPHKGHLSALKTLGHAGNLAQKLYVASALPDKFRVTVTEYATFGSEAEKFLTLLEIFIDWQHRLRRQDGVRIHQPSLRKSIQGFDVRDIVGPFATRYVIPRTQKLDAQGSGWSDLVCEAGITTIFGRDFGELIRPDDNSRVCREWASVPTGSNYLVSSTYTLKMLHGGFLKKNWPALEVDQLSPNLEWFSPREPGEVCGCAGAETPGKPHVNPVQFLASKKSWKAKYMSRGMKPLDVTALSGQGAVIFGHLPFFSMEKAGGRVK